MECIRGRVLIVEDDLLLSMVQERLIQKLGHEVIAKVSRGTEAIAKVEELNPDVVIMDISINGDLNGIETMEQIRKKSEVPVIYLSGSYEKYYYERAKKIGFLAYLTKPIGTDDLKKPLLNALARQNYPRQQASMG